MNKVWCFADTHELHDQLLPPKADIAIFAGDAANSSNPIKNLVNMRHFLTWFKDLPIKHKVMIAGNHDTSIDKRLVIPEEIEEMGINYLEHEAREIAGIKFFGSPYTPAFNPQTWSFNVKRNKLDLYWSTIPDDTQILVTHGPAKGFLDYTDDFDSGNPIQVGCKSLSNRINQIKDIKMHVFGHIHTSFSKNSSFYNSGTYRGADKITRINASCYTDRLPRVLTSNGYVIQWDNGKVLI